MSYGERWATVDGAITGTAAGLVISAYPALAQGAGGGAGGNSLAWLGAGAILGGLLGGSLGYLAAREWPGLAPSDRPEKCSRYSLISPCAGQFDLQVGSPIGFTGPGSIVRVREFRVPATGLHLNYLGMTNEQLPTLDARYWLTDLGAIHFRFRYFVISGSRFFRQPFFFNGTQIAGGQTVSTNPDWFSLGIYYERRLRPWYEGYENGWPPWLQGWDLRGRLGLEYTYLNFVMSGAGTSTSPGHETKEDFYHQSMPLPTIGLEAYRRLNENLIFQGSIEGNWINRWNSLRSEGGTVWASQNGFEGHARLIFENPRYLSRLRLMAGMFVYYYSQLEDSHEDGNFIRWSSFGPEIDIGYSF